MVLVLFGFTLKDTDKCLFGFIIRPGEADYYTRVDSFQGGKYPPQLRSKGGLYCEYRLEFLQSNFTDCATGRGCRIEMHFLNKIGNVGIL